MAFYCKYCGYEYKDVRVLLNLSCSKSPAKKHIVYDGNNTDPFIYRHCGTSHNKANVLLTLSCAKSPTKKHELL